MWLNADVGESYGIWEMGQDEALIPYLDIANIACGMHAGDPAVMDRTVALAKKNKVKIAAHPGYPDRLGFGRKRIPFARQELKNIVLYQIGALEAICRAHQVSLEYVKPHGALYNETVQNEVIWEAVAAAIADFDKRLKWIFLSSNRNGYFLEKAKKYGLDLVFEAFADRTYTEDSILLSREYAQGVLQEPQLILEQAQLIREKQLVATYPDNKKIALSAQVLCVHGDNPASLEAVKKISLQWKQK